MKIVVIGGSGLIGTKVVQTLRQLGHEVVAASRSTGINTMTGEGLAEAFAGRAGGRRRGELAVVRRRAGDGVLRDVGAQHGCSGSGGRRGTPRGAVGRRHRAPSGEWLLPREARPGAADQGVEDSLHHRPGDPVLRVHGQHRPFGRRRGGDPPATCPHAADRVRRRGGRDAAVRSDAPPTSRAPGRRTSEPSSEVSATTGESRKRKPRVCGHTGCHWRARRSSMPSRRSARVPNACTDGAKSARAAIVSPSRTQRAKVSSQPATVRARSIRRARARVPAPARRRPVHGRRRASSGRAAGSDCP